MKATAYQTQGSRLRQEDRYLCDAERGIFVVADGLGGHDDGDLAAETAIESLRQWGRADLDRPQDHLVELGIQSANLAVCKLGTCRVTGTLQHKMSCYCRTPGCTLTGLWWVQGVPVLGHVGDSRCYVLTGAGDLLRQSEDHRQWGFLSKRLGDDRLQPQIRIYQPNPHEGATWLLCSDGLTDALTDAELCALLVRGADAEALVDAALAKQRESQDNITAIVVRP